MKSGLDRRPRVPRHRRGRGLLALVCATGVIGVGTPSPGLAAAGSETFVTMYDESTYGPINGGRNWVWYPGDSTIAASWRDDLDMIEILASGGNRDEEYHLIFSAPLGEELSTGVFPRAQDAWVRDPGRPGITIYGEGKGCDSSGSFSIRELRLGADEVVEKLWLVYEHSCGPRPYRSGEIRINIDGDGGNLVLGPGVIRWPDDDPRALPRDVPVTVINSSSIPTMPGAATINGDPLEFRVLEDGCAGHLLIPAARCVVRVRYTPQTPGEKSAELTIPEPDVDHSIPLSGFVHHGTTSWLIVSEPGHWVGQGQVWSYDPSNAAIEFHGDSENLWGWAWGVGQERWHVSMRPPEGQHLKAGVTYAATSLRTSSTGTLALGVEGRGCQVWKSSFTVNQLELSIDGDPARVDVSFEHRCTESNAALRGRLRWRSTSTLPERQWAERTVALRVRNERLVGRVAVIDGPHRCAKRVRVRIEKKRNGTFVTIKRVRTFDRGRFNWRLRSRRGVYRVIAPRIDMPGALTCRRAISDRVRDYSLWQ